MKGHRNFEQIWQEKMLNASITPSDRVWEAIALQIDEKHQQKRRKILAWWAAAILALFLGDGELVYQSKGLIGKWFSKTANPDTEITQNADITSTNTFRTIPPRNTKNVRINKFVQIFNEGEIKQENQLNIQAKAEFETEKKAVLPKKHEQELTNEKVGTPKAKRWWVQRNASIGSFRQNWHYTPLSNLAGRMLSTPQEQFMLKREENLLKEIATYRTLCTWTIGTDLGFQINKNWYVSSGFQWRSNYAIFQSNAPVPIIAKFYGNVPNLDAEAPPTNTLVSTPTIEMVEGELNQISALPTATETEITYRHTTEFISIPLKVGYQVQKNKWRCAVAVGTEANFLVNSTFSSENATYSSVFQKVNRVQYAGLAELQIGYQVAPKLYLQIAPSFRNTFTPLFKDFSALQVQNQQSWFIGVGLQKRL